MIEFFILLCVIYIALKITFPKDSLKARFQKWLDEDFGSEQDEQVK